MRPLLLLGKVLSRWGDSSNMSPKDVELPDDSLLPPLENLKGGDRLSGAGFGMPRCAECALVRARDGRSMLERLLLYNPGPVRLFPSGTGLMGESAYSYGACFGASRGDSCNGLGAAEDMGESAVPTSGVGEGSSTSVDLE